MLTGSCTRGIDSKFRLAMPAEYREAFSLGGFIVSRGRYIALFPNQEYREFVARLQRDVDAKTLDGKALRSFAAGSFQFTLDGAGRLVIPLTLRELLPDGDVLLAGAFSHLGLWNPSEFQQQVLDADELYSTLEAYG